MFDKKAWSRAYYLANRESKARYYQENRAGFLERAKLNAQRRSAFVLIKRRVWAGEVNPGAIPPWLTDEQRDAMQWFYDEARRLTKETGVSYVVDHIAPLNGVHTCGLHVPWNLQVLTDAANKRKRFREDSDF